MAFTITVDGKTHSVEGDDAMPMLWVLRDVLAMTSTKLGCGRALCGACTTHLDARRANADHARGRRSDRTHRRLSVVLSAKLVRGHTEDLPRRIARHVRGEQEKANEDLLAFIKKSAIGECAQLIEPRQGESECAKKSNTIAGALLALRS
jgi:2Fe-2S iron-sulfur cluster binding domain